MRKSDAKFLSETIDKNLGFDEFAYKLCFKANRKLSTLSRMSRFFLKL